MKNKKIHLFFLGLIFSMGVVVLFSNDVSAIGCNTISGGIYSGSLCMPVSEIVSPGTVMSNVWAPAGYHQKGFRDFTCLADGNWSITYEDGAY